MTAPEIVAALRAYADPKNVAGMARYGISTTGTLGVPMPVIRRLARQAGRGKGCPLGQCLRHASA